MQELILQQLLQVEEVSGLQWVSLNKLENMVKTKNFFNYQELPYVISFINVFKTNRELSSISFGFHAFYI